MTWEEIEIATATEDVLEEVRTCKVRCWMSCTVAPGMKRRPHVPLHWIASGSPRPDGTVR